MIDDLVEDGLEALLRPRRKKTDFAGFVTVAFVFTIFTLYAIWLLATRPIVWSGDIFTILVVTVVGAAVMDSMIALVVFARRRG